MLHIELIRKQPKIKNMMPGDDSMSNHFKITLISFILTLIFWTITIVFNLSGFELILPIFASISSIIFICFCVICICRKINKNVSAYRIFAIADSCIGIVVFIYAIYDIMTDTGWFAGLIGVLLLIFIIPIVIILHHFTTLSMIAK